MFREPFVQAFAFGLLSAASLPLGAIAARIWLMPDRAVAALLAFGAGALLSALAIDLVGEALQRGEFAPLAVGAVSGGLLFSALNQMLNGQGGFLRKPATTLRYLRGIKAKRLRTLFEKLSTVPLFQQLPAEEIAALVPSIHSRVYQAGSTIIRQGEPGDTLFVVERGTVDIMDFRRQVKVATLSVGDAFGEMSLVTGEPRSATAVASTETRVWLLLKDDFDRLIASSPRLAGAVAGLAKERISVLRARGEVPEEEAARWSARAARHVDEELLLPTATEIREAASEYSGAPLAIWLGSLLDGLAESIVIGASLTHVGVSASLLAGVFLSNFPEALSSSAAMRQNNVRFGRIFWMWTSLLALGGGGAALGNLFLVGASPSAFTVVQGVTAGAMLTMVAETMLPEAFHKGGAITGITTLLGFLVALFFKTLG